MLSPSPRYALWQRRITSRPDALPSRGRLSRSSLMSVRFTCYEAVRSQCCCAVCVSSDTARSSLALSVQPDTGHGWVSGIRFIGHSDAWPWRGLEHVSLVSAQPTVGSASLLTQRSDVHISALLLYCDVSPGQFWKLSVYLRISCNMALFSKIWFPSNLMYHTTNTVVYCLLAYNENTNVLYSVFR